MDNTSFQAQMVVNHCWGCGEDNEHGLKIRSYWSGDESVCTWQPEDYHSAAASHVLNGGLIATLIDCHCLCTAIAAGYRAEEREIGTGTPIWFATGSLQVSYRNPTPIQAPITVRAQITDQTERRINLNCTLSAKGEERAIAELVAVRVPLEWMQP
ncbi:MAG: PaaI family thioesterase [SAR202 cluster bacterium]|nr:PaaI family thioesterase [SAR202 cluster bacterium]MDP6512564.1 PaaI family thioesterase [SAR202 cluster bacterium]MDP6714451.1 PaaI family thioesterase [SAR202 cluster bacterium]